MWEECGSSVHGSDSLVMVTAIRYRASDERRSFRRESWVPCFDTISISGRHEGERATEREHVLHTSRGCAW